MSDNAVGKSPNKKKFEYSEYVEIAKELVQNEKKFMNSNDLFKKVQLNLLLKNRGASSLQKKYNEELTVKAKLEGVLAHELTFAQKQALAKSYKLDLNLVRPTEDELVEDKDSEELPVAQKKKVSIKEEVSKHKSPSKSASSQAAESIDDRITDALNVLIELCIEKTTEKVLQRLGK